MQELVRGLGYLLKKGWKPLRTILIASWDAEEVVNQLFITAIFARVPAPLVTTVVSPRRTVIGPERMAVDGGPDKLLASGSGGADSDWRQDVGIVIGNGGPKPGVEAGKEAQDESGVVTKRGIGAASLAVRQLHSPFE